MVATLKIFVDIAGSNGSPGNNIDTTALGPPNIRLKTADDNTIDTNNPVPVPAAGVNRTFAKSCYVKVSVAPGTQINNLKLYTAGSDFGTGINTYVGDQFPTRNHSSTSGYKTATGSVGTSGDAIIGAPLSYVTSKTGLFTFTSGSPMTGPSISETSNILVNINDTSNYFILQTEVGTTAASGDQADATITLQYDEI